MNERLDIWSDTMEPLKSLYADYLMRLSEQYPGLDNMLVPEFIPADQIHDYANAYGPGGQFYNPLLQAQAARQSGRQNPPQMFWATYEAAGMGKVVNGAWEWATHMVTPYEGMPRV